jgi:teichuronic acid exporter
MKNFKILFLKGMFWTTIEMGINRSFKFFIKLILARVLFPEDYGIVGMAVVFTSIISVFNEMGMGEALIQRKKEFLTKDHFNTAFWTGLVWSVCIFLIVVFLVSPIAAKFYDEPILTQIIPALSIGILISPINLIHKAKLIRDLNFKKISFISNTSTIVAGVIALVMAINGAGVWALVFNTVATFIVALPMWFIATKWIPSFKFSRSAFKDIFGFGVYTTGTTLFGKINGQIDYLIVGKLLGSASLGIYSLAFLLTSIARTQITQVIDQVLYPMFSKIQDDSRKLNSYYLKIVKLNSYIIYPLMFGVILFSKNLIPILFGDKWDEAIPILEILSVGVILSMTTTSSHILIRASGHPKMELILSTISSLCFFIPLIILGTYLYGVRGTAFGYVLAIFLQNILILSYLYKKFNISLSQTINSLGIPLTSSLIPFAITSYFQTSVDFWIMNLIIYSCSIVILLLMLAKRDLLILRKTFLEMKANRG